MDIISLKCNLFSPWYKWKICSLVIIQQIIHSLNVWIILMYNILLCVFTFWVPCCDVRYDLRIRIRFSSSLPPVVCMGGSCLIHIICVCLHTMMSKLGTHIVFCFVCLCLVYPILPVSLECPILIAPLVFSNVYFLVICHLSLTL
jgi:hypothetical protein